MSHLYFVFGKGGGGGYDTHQLTPVNNVAFVLCIWKVEHSPKHQMQSTNATLFAAINFCFREYLLPSKYKGQT
jgi:hypothetical protein